MGWWFTTLWVVVAHSVVKPYWTTEVVSVMKGMACEMMVLCCWLKRQECQCVVIIHGVPGMLVSSVICCVEGKGGDWRKVVKRRESEEEQKRRKKEWIQDKHKSISNSHKKNHFTFAD